MLEPLADDDRTGLRILYPDSKDVVHIGSIQGRILPANPLSLPTSPPHVTGLFARRHEVPAIRCPRLRISVSSSKANTGLAGGSVSSAPFSETRHRAWGS